MFPLLSNLTFSEKGIFLSCNPSGSSCAARIFQERGQPCPRSLRLFALILLTAFCFCGSRSAAQPVMITLVTNGPVSNRLNVVLFSEGYTTNQLGQFLVDATNAVKALLAAAPFQEYSNYFNAFAIPVASNESGSDHPVYPQFRDTYFNSSYDPDSDLLITIPPDFADTNYSHGQGRVDALLQSNLPNCHLPVILVNDPVFGGSDGFGKVAIAARGSSASVFVVHESGHVFANLGDEYTTPNPDYPDTEEPNTTTQTNFDLIKWKSWIDTNTTPVPTPATAAYANVVGLFEGAHYHETGWYRPQLNCAMGNFSSPFCAVCSEALVLSLYSRVRPVDSFTPAVTNLSAASTQAVTFALSVLQPATHNLSIQWRTNGMPVPGETNLAFNLVAGSLGSGGGEVSAFVKDETLLVRNDPDNGLSQIVNWIVTVENVALNLDSAGFLPDGSFSFRVTGNAPQGFVIQSSTNFLDWNSLTTNFLVNGRFVFTNASPVLSVQFFRAVAAP